MPLPKRRSYKLRCTVTEYLLLYQGRTLYTLSCSPLVILWSAWQVLRQQLGQLQAMAAAAGLGGGFEGVGAEVGGFGATVGSAGGGDGATAFGGTVSGTGSPPLLGSSLGGAAGFSFAGGAGGAGGEGFGGAGAPGLPTSPGFGGGGCGGAGGASATMGQLVASQREGERLRAQVTGGLGAALGDHYKHSCQARQAPPPPFFPLCAFVVSIDSAHSRSTAGCSDIPPPTPLALAQPRLFFSLPLFSFSQCCSLQVSKLRAEAAAARAAFGDFEGAREGLERRAALAEQSIAQLEQVCLLV